MGRVRSLQDQISALGTRGTIIIKELINQVAEIIRQKQNLVAGITFYGSWFINTSPNGNRIHCEYAWIHDSRCAPA